MRTFKALVGAAAIAAAAIPVAAQAQQAGSVIVFNYDRVLADSNAGNDLEQRLNAIREQMRGEVQPEQTALQTEQQRLQAAVQGQTPEAVRANSQLQQQAQDLQRRGQALAQREQQLARDYQYTEAQALNEYNRQLTPIVREVMQQRGASVVMNSSAVAIFQPSVDVTDDVMNRFNSSVRTINVTRQSAPAPQQAPPSR